MIKLLLILFPLLCAGLQATELPEDHFLYPREIEPLWLIGIERGLSLSSTVRNLERCDTPERLTTPFRQFHCQLAGEVRLQEELALNYQKDFADLTLFGETHTVKESQQLVAKIIKEAPAGTFQAMAFEMFNSSAQEEVNRLTQAKASRAQWRALLEKHWNYDSKGYLDIIEEALKKGMNILALDDRQKNIQGSFVDTFSRDLIYRDQHMKNNLLNYYRAHPHHKVLFLTGKLHSLKTMGEDLLTITESLKIDLGDTFTTKHWLIFNRKRAPLLNSLNSKEERGLFYRLNGAVNQYADGAFIF